jgi:hypothetical protein
LPRLHVAHLRPAVEGIVVENGKPIPAVELFLAKFPGTNQPCTEVGETIAVSPDGEFSWPARQEHKLMDSMINPLEVRGALTVLCIRHPGKGTRVGAMLFIRQNQSVSLRLVCDLARPHGSGAGPHTASIMLWPQHCESRIQTSLQAVYATGSIR